MATDKQKKVYPVSSQLEEDLSEQLKAVGLTWEDTRSGKLLAIREMVEAVGEYEHGAAEVADLLPELHELLGNGNDDDDAFQAEAVMLRAMAAVVRDMALTIMYQS